MARSFEVVGWVKNEPDGSVRCDLEGDRGELDAFLSAVESAMDGAVESMDEVTAFGIELPADGVHIRH